MIDLTPRTPYRQRTGILFGAVMIGHLILISAQVQSKAGVPVLEGITFGVFSRIQGGAAGFIRGIGNIWSSYVGLRGVQAENLALRQQVAELEVRLQEQRALASSARNRLQAVLNLRESTTLPTLPAEVIAGNSNPGLMTVTVNRGSADGVQADMAVIAPKGVVGRIVGPVAAHAARVQLLIDRNAAAGIVTERTRAGGMAVGINGDPPLSINIVSNLADVAPGDVVVASGVDGIYPKGFVIGTVEKSERGPSLHRLIAVRPTVKLSSLEEVLIVLVPARGAILGGRASRERRVTRKARRRSEAHRRDRRPRWRVALQTTLAGLTIGGATAVNLVLVAVIYVALAFGPVAGLLAGSVGGLVQDALAGGIVGVGGFSKTLVGFLVGLLGAQFIVAQSLPRLFMFVSGTLVHELCYQALYALVESRAFRMQWSAA